MTTQLIKTTSNTIGQDTVETVNARELHEFLGVGRDFATWIKERIAKYNFLENQDFIVFPETGENTSTGRPRADYAITFDMAKELSMVENSPKGQQARRYFIECERRLKANTPAFQIPQTLGGALRLAADLAEKVELEEAKNTQLTIDLNNANVDVQALARITASGVETNIREGAKTLGVTQTCLTNWLLNNKWMFRDANDYLRVYATKIKSGHMNASLYEYRPGKVRTQSLITAKGLTTLAKKNI